MEVGWKCANARPKDMQLARCIRSERMYYNCEVHSTQHHDNLVRNDDRGKGGRRIQMKVGAGREWRWGGRAPTIKVIMQLNYK